MFYFFIINKILVENKYLNIRSVIIYNVIFKKDLRMKCINCGREIKEKLKEYKYRHCTDVSCFIVIRKHCPYCGWPISKETIYEGKKNERKNK